MNMTPKSMSSNESSGEGDNIVMKLNSNSAENFFGSDGKPGNYFKFKLDDVTENSKIFEF
jgi:hypothetical protein